MEPMVVHQHPSRKDQVRTQVLAAIEALSPADRQREAEDLVAALDQKAYAGGFDVVLATLPLGNEADLTPFLGRWLASGRRVALARTGPGRSLSFGYVSSLEGPWEPRPFGLREPPASVPAWTPGPRTLCLVPGVAFSPGDRGRWHRLGRGAGYYDRWLAAHGAQVTTWGVGFSVQRVEEVPVEAHDRDIDGMVGQAV